MRQTCWILLFSLLCGTACSLHKTAPVTDSDGEPVPKKKFFHMPLPPQDGEDHFWEQNWRNNG